MPELNNMSQQKIGNFNIGLTDNLKNTYEFLIAEHLIKNCKCAEKFSVDLFSFQSKLHSSFHLKVLETIHIFSNWPSLCKQRECLLRLNIILI